MRYAGTTKEPLLPVEAVAGVRPGRAWIVGQHVEHWLTQTHPDLTPDVKLHPASSSTSPMGDSWTLSWPEQPEWPIRWISYLDYLRRDAILAYPSERMAVLDCDGLDFTAESAHVLSIHSTTSTKESDDG